MTTKKSCRRNTGRQQLRMRATTLPFQAFLGVKGALRREPRTRKRAVRKKQGSKKPREERMWRRHILACHRKLKECISQCCRRSNGSRRSSPMLHSTASTMRMIRTIHSALKSCRAGMPSLCMRARKWSTYHTHPNPTNTNKMTSTSVAMPSTSTAEAVRGITHPPLFSTHQRSLLASIFCFFTASSPCPSPSASRQNFDFRLPVHSSSSFYGSCVRGNPLSAIFFYPQRATNKITRPLHLLSPTQTQTDCKPLTSESDQAPLSQPFVCSFFFPTPFFLLNLRFPGSTSHIGQKAAPGPFSTSEYPWRNESRLQKWGKMATTKIPTWEEESGTRFYYWHHIPLVLRPQSSLKCARPARRWL